MTVPSDPREELRQQMKPAIRAAYQRLGWDDTLIFDREYDLLVEAVLSVPVLQRALARDAAIEQMKVTRGIVELPELGGCVTAVMLADQLRGVGL